MANSKSALKRARQTETKTARNRIIKSRIKATRKRILAAVEAGEKETAAEESKKFASQVDKAAKTGVIHKNTASRYKSRVATHVKSLAS